MPMGWGGGFYSVGGGAETRVKSSLEFPGKTRS